MIDPILLGKARSLVARLELVSHGRTANLSPEPGRSAEVASVFPPGGIARNDDREPDHPLKSHEHFRRRLAGARDSRTVELLVGEMETALRAWTHSAPPPKDSKAWEREVAKQPGSCVDVGRSWGISAARVHQLRVKYREVA